MVVVSIAVAEEESESPVVPLGGPSEFGAPGPAWLESCVWECGAGVAGVNRSIGGIDFSWGRSYGGAHLRGASEVSFALPVNTCSSPFERKVGARKEIETLGLLNRVEIFLFASFVCRLAAN